MISVMSPEIVPRPMLTSCFRPVKSMPSSSTGSPFSSSFGAFASGLAFFHEPNARALTEAPRRADARRPARGAPRVAGTRAVLATTNMVFSRATTRVTPGATLEGAQPQIGERSDARTSADLH